MYVCVETLGCYRSPEMEYRGHFASGGHGFLLAQLCAAPQFLMPVQKASSSHPHWLPWLLLRSLASIWPALPGWRGPLLERHPGVGGKAARSCDSALTGREGQGFRWHRDMAELWQGLLGFPTTTPSVSKKGRKDEGDGEAGAQARRENGLQARRKVYVRSKGHGEGEGAWHHLCPHKRPK